MCVCVYVCVSVYVCVDILCLYQTVSDTIKICFCKCSCYECTLYAKILINIDYRILFLVTYNCLLYYHLSLIC